MAGKLSPGVFKAFCFHSFPIQLSLMHPPTDHISDKKFWLTFFREAGFAMETAQNYSKVFVENRMTLQHLRFLTKDLLKEMGIAAVGDMITIIEHIKSVDVDVFEILGLYLHFLENIRSSKFHDRFFNHIHF